MADLFAAFLTNPIVAFAGLVCVVVFVHELGHYLAGILLGIEAEEFSIGFGPKAFGFKVGPTEFKVCWLPLGGYVRFYGSEIGVPVPAERRKFSLLDSPVYKRAIVSAAGPFANFVLSFAVMLGLSLYGLPQPAPIVSVIPNSAAQQGGLRDGDRIRKIQVENAPLSGSEITSWVDLNRIVSQNAGKVLLFEVERGAQTLTVKVTPDEKDVETHLGDKAKVGRIGVSQFLSSPRIVLDNSSPLFQAGLRSGDLVVRVGSEDIQYGHQIPAAMAGLSASSPLSIEVLRPAKGTSFDDFLQSFEPPVKKGGASWFNKGTLPSQESTNSLAPQKVVLSLPGSAGSGSLGLFATDLTIKKFEDFASGDPRISAVENLRSCGLVPGDTLLGFAASGPASQKLSGNATPTSTAPFFTSPVQFSASFELFLKELRSRLAAVSPAELPQYLRTVVQIRVLRWGGMPEVLSCGLEPRQVKDALGRAVWTLDFPVQFVTSGVAVPPVIVRSQNFWDGLKDAGVAVAHQSTTIYFGLKKLFTGGLPLSSLGGPISIARVASDAASGGLLLFLLTISWMSINIGMFNLLPLPALDGGALLLQGVEGAYGKPLPLQVQAMVQRIGIVVILILIVVVFFNDIVRLFSYS